jgi:hypothetical protein
VVRVIRALAEQHHLLPFGAFLVEHAEPFDRLRDRGDVRLHAGHREIGGHLAAAELQARIADVGGEAIFEADLEIRIALVENQEGSVGERLVRRSGDRTVLYRPYRRIAAPAVQRLAVEDRGETRRDGGVARLPRHQRRAHRARQRSHTYDCETRFQVMFADHRLVLHPYCGSATSLSPACVESL